MPLHPCRRTGGVSMRCCPRLSAFAGWAVLAVATAALVAGAWRLTAPRPAEARQGERAKGLEFDGAAGWLNTAGPLKMKDLRGKIVVLDFWTLCCINCIHVLPDLDKLEKKYPNEVVVVGVHTAKFDTEKTNESIRKAVLRYEIKHPVVNDADKHIWRAFGAKAWPTIMIVDPEGNLVYNESGEGQYGDLDRAIADLIKEHKKKKTLNTRPMKFDLAQDGKSPLFFPGKVLADPASKRLIIADSTHHRIVVTDLEGKKIAIAGDGEAGAKDGEFAKARFNDPQGMALRGDTLYVADRKNHLVRELDLKKGTVKTIAGTGSQGMSRDVDEPALKAGLNSPWDLLLDGDRLFIAMAGHHQIWVMDLKKGRAATYAGDGGEDITDGTLSRSQFAQPSGLATDGKTLYVADSETSSVRAVPLGGRGEVRTLVGLDLFKFGDRDGIGANVLLQHALGVAYHDGLLYVADTYNSKIKTLDPKTKETKTFLGGEAAGWLATPLFSEPGGIWAAGGKLYVADTNAHRIRIVDIKTKTVSTLKLSGVEAPKPAK
ncbi:MAG: redoxin domain-containing protein [Gemmataceae bacterium]|nr:redoxin domain-containing protein [Gemmataceae bacterium]